MSEQELRPRQLRLRLRALGSAALLLCSVLVALSGGRPVPKLAQSAMQSGALPAPTRGNAEQMATQAYVAWRWGHERLAAQAGVQLYRARFSKLPQDLAAAAIGVAGKDKAPYEGWWGLPSAPQGGQPSLVELPLD